MAIILASSSAIRRSMMEQAGVSFTHVPPTVDEGAEKALHSDPRSLATALAKAKAEAVSGKLLDDLVIGSDSVVSVGSRMFDKPANRAEAAEHLRFFSGRAMQLTSGVAIAQGGEAGWSHCDTAQLQVRPLSEAFISAYLDAEWPEVGYCVGVFRLEGRGVQLFETIDGSYFTILGMPLLPLLGELRARGAIAS